MTNLLFRLGLALLLVCAVVGLLVLMAQARFEYRKRKAFKEIDRVIQKGRSRAS